MKIIDRKAAPKNNVIVLYLQLNQEYVDFISASFRLNFNNKLKTEKRFLKEVKFVDILIINN